VTDAGPPHPPRRPDLFIIGAPKAGTTSLYEYLLGHPDVYMSRIKEPGYFAPDVPRRQQPLVFGRDEARYLALFAEASGQRRVGEASTQYLFSRRAPELIRDFQPRAWLVAMVRSPVDMMRSLHGQRVSMGVDQLEDFERALAADLEPGFGGGIRRKTIERAGTYRERARLGEQLERWLAVFPRQRLHVIVFEDFTADAPAAFRRLLEFLEVGTAFEPASFAVHNPRHRERQGLSRALLRNPLSRWVSRSVLPATMGSAGAARAVRRVRLSKLSVKRAAPTRVDPALRRRLEVEFAPDVEQLGRLLDRDLTTLWFGARSAAESQA
jgi:hypothetical protein